MEIENRGQRKAGGRGQLPDTARLCALQPGRMQMSLMLMTPPLWPSVVKGRHSIIQSRSGGELASLHLSSSNGPSTGYQGRWALNKGGITSRYESRLLFWAPHAHWGYRVRGVPRKMAFTQCTSVSNNGISMPSVFFLEGFDLLLAAVVCTSLPVSCVWHSTCIWKFKGVEAAFLFYVQSHDVVWRFQDLLECKELEIFMQIFSLPGSVPSFSSSSSSLV